MNNHTIRFATLDDVENIMQFIDVYWKQGHILSKSKSLFLYEHQHEKAIDYVLAIDNRNNELAGICGFIRNQKELQGSDIWTTMWKVKKTDAPMLGVEILNFIKVETKCNTMSSCGIAFKILPIFQYLGYQTGKLTHYYRLNDKVNYHVAVVNKKVISTFNSFKSYELLLFSSLEELEINQQVFFNHQTTQRKDLWYLNKRYFQHPQYSYKIWGIINSGIAGLIVGREIAYNHTKVLRIVDFLGDSEALRYIGNSIQNLLNENSYEYVDFYCTGIDSAILNDAGFIARDENDKNIIPNFFEPFVQENKELYFFTTSDKNIRIFKADGDQDRPNFIQSDK